MFAPVNNQKAILGKKGEPFATQGKDTFTWTGEHQEALDLLKSHLPSAPVLGFSDFTRPFELETASSLQGLGSILSQQDKQIYCLT